MLGLLARYASIGVVNTVIHWGVFGALVLGGAPQSVSNVAGFGAAATFSFYANARWTFRAKATKTRYGLYVAFMGALAALVGWGADRTDLHPILTLAAFSLASLLVGFAYSRLVVFRGAA